MNELLSRLWQLFDLVEKEDRHLQGVKSRFFSDSTSQGLAPAALSPVLESAEGIDRLESFVGKFSRMQDTLMDKLLPAFLRAIGEPVGSVIDNLNRADRLGILERPEEWIAMRHLRNRLVHEYVEDIEQLAAALEKAESMAGSLHVAYSAMRDYCLARPELARPAKDEGSASGSSGGH